MCIGLVMPSNHLILCRPLLLPSIFPSIRVFSNESALRIRWPKCWSCSFSSVLPMNTQDWSPLGWTGWISLQSKGLSRVFSNTTVQKHQFKCVSLNLFSRWRKFTLTSSTPHVYFLFHKVLFSNLVALTVSCLSLRAWRWNWRSEVLILVPITLQKKNHCQM